MNSSIKKKSINAGLKEAEIITKQDAKTFYFASRYLPKNKRYAAYTVYAMCRISDDSVDNSHRLSNSVNLSQIKEKIESVYENREIKDNLLLAFKETINKYRIPKRYFDELTEGMYMDLNKNRYQDFNELYTYCYKVAGIVGLIMLNILGYNNQEAESRTVDLGVAMQLTNILRDIKEDYQLERIYLPQDEMARFKVSENQIAQGRVDENFIALLKFQIQRAREFYNNSHKGIKMITDLKSRLVVCMMKDMYAGILQSIENNNFDVFSKRAHINVIGKIGTTIKILFKAKFL